MGTSSYPLEYNHISVEAREGTSSTVKLVFNKMIGAKDIFEIPSKSLEGPDNRLKFDNSHLYRRQTSIQPFMGNTMLKKN